MTAPATVTLAFTQWLPLAIGALAAVVWVVIAMRRGTEPVPPEDPLRPTEERARETAKRAAAVRRRSTLFAGLGVAATVWALGGQPTLAVATFIAWYALTSILRARRENRALAVQEAHALAAISTASRALRAGIPMAGVLAILAKEAQGDAGAAFREIMQREELGEELPSAVKRVLLASPLASLRAFGLALLVQLTAGGNIADASERLAQSLVERNRVRRRAQTVVAYGRAAAFMLALLPIAVVALMSSKVDGYAQFVFDRPIGNGMLALSTVLVVSGLVVVQRMCRIDRAPAWRGT